jgi:hypothetical protein
MQKYKDTTQIWSDRQIISNIGNGRVDHTWNTLTSKLVQYGCHINKTMRGRKGMCTNLGAVLLCALLEVFIKLAKSPVSGTNKRTTRRAKIQGKDTMHLQHQI